MSYFGQTPPPPPPVPQPQPIGKGAAIAAGAAALGLGLLAAFAGSKRKPAGALRGSKRGCGCGR